MFLRRCVMAILFFLGILWTSLARAEDFKEGVWLGQEVEYLEGKVLVRWQPNAGEREKSAVLDEIGGTFVRTVGGCGWELLSVDSKADVPALAEELLHYEDVWKSEPLIRAELGSDYGDPNYGVQWNWKNTGQLLWVNVEEGDTAIAANGASGFFSYALDVVDSCGIVRYGWLDSGLGLDSNGIAFCEDLRDTARIIFGKNTTSEGDSSDIDDTGWPFVYHGGETMSIVAATRDNNIGIAGIDPNSIFLVVKVMALFSSQVEVVDGFSYAIEQGVDIINFSGGFYTMAACIEDEIARADTAGILVATITGNHGPFWFPGGYASLGTNQGYEEGYRNVIATGGTDERDSLMEGSRTAFATQDSLLANGDTLQVTVAAPGDFVPVAKYDHYGTTGGTSVACPHVAALAGLLLAKYGDISPDSIRTIIENTSDKIWQDTTKPAYDSARASWSSHPWYGQGRINAWRALTWDELWGKYSSNQTWSGDTVIASDIVIDSGVTVTIEPGTTLRVRPIDHYDAAGQADSNRAEIIVRGTLIADAQGDDPITFEPYNSVPADSTSWYGIRVVGNGRIVFRNVEIRNAYLPIDLASTVPDTVYNCAFTNNRLYGIYVRNDSASSLTTMVRKNTISKDSTISLTGYGIRTDNSPTIDSNLVEFYGYGIYSFTDSPQLKANTLHCCAFGVHVRSTAGAKVWYNRFTGSLGSAIDYWNATVSTLYNQVCIDTTDGQDSCSIGLAFGPWGAGEVWYNQFYNCYDYGATISGSFPDFGENSEVIKGQNWFRIPPWSGTDTAFALYSLNTIEAEKNFWQLDDSTLVDSASIDFWVRGSGSVDVTPFLTTAPDYSGGGQGSKLAAYRDVLPGSFALEQNFPNPFNPSTFISYSLRKPGYVRLEVLNLLGQRVTVLVEGLQPAGVHQVVWNGKDSAGRDCASGVYFYRVTSNDVSQTKKMLLLK